MTKQNLINKILVQGVEEIIIKENLIKKLTSKKKLNVKFGIDPTSPDLHLGHLIGLKKLKQFQELNHNIILIIGDFTAQIGDPSLRNQTRPPLSEKQIKNNTKTYLNQIKKIIDLSKAKIYYNSEWLKKGLKDLLKIAQSATIQQILEREDFQKRLKEGSQITYLEGFYPLLQGYDSVKIKADVEIGGSDQKFNMLMARKIQRFFNQEEQDIITLTLLEGTDGIRKMSKSYHNYIAFKEKPFEMFSKIMKIPDNLIEKYFKLLTDIEMPNLENYRDQKIILAQEIVKIFYDEKTALKTKENWEKIFSKKEIQKADLPILKLKKVEIKLIDLVILAGIKSKNEAKRLIAQKAVEINQIIQTNPFENIKLKNQDILKIGKKIIYKIIIS